MDTQLLIADISRFTSIVLSVVGLVYWIYIYIKYKLPGAIAPIIWLLNMTAFYVYVLIVTTKPLTEDVIENLNLWSSIVHLLAGILLIAAAIILNSFLEKRKCKKTS